MYQTRPRKQESPRPHQHHSTPSLKESLLILRPLTHLSGGVIPFSRESVDSLAGSPLSLFTFMVRDSIRSLVLPPLLHSSWYGFLVFLYLKGGILLAIRFVLFILFLKSGFWVANSCILVSPSCMGLFPGLSSLATNYTLATRLV